MYTETKKAKVFMELGAHNMDVAVLSETKNKGSRNEIKREKGQSRSMNSS